MAQNANTTAFDTKLYEKWLHRLLSHWHVFVLFLGIAYAGTYLYLRYAVTLYAVSASILIKDASQNINPFESSRTAFGADYGYSRSYNLSNDIKMLSARRLVQEAIAKMDWRVNYFLKGKLKNTQVYPFHTFKVLFDDQQEYIPYGVEFFLQPLDKYSFRLSVEKIDGWKNIPERTYRLNEPLVLNGFTCTISGYELPYRDREAGFMFIIQPLDAHVNRVLSNLRVMQLDKNSSVLTIATQGECAQWEIDFINNLCQVYMTQTLADKNATHERAITFIDNQLLNIGDTLQSLESRMVRYRKKFSGINLEQIAEKRFTKLEMLEEERAKYMLSMRYFLYLKNYLLSKKSYTDIVAPASVGLDEPILANLIKELLDLTLKQNISFKVEPYSNNPFQLENETKIQQIKKNILEVLQNMEATYQIKQEDLEKRIQLLYGTAYNLLESERSYYELKRQYKINEEMYNHLLKKKSEMSIIKAGNVSDTKIVDYARVTGIPFPNAQKTYSTNLIIAFLAALGLVVLRYLFTYKVMDKEDVTSECSMAFLGAIGHMPDKDNLVILNKPRSIMAESFRSIRANLQFFMQGSKKIIVISSSLSGDGKTFVSLNIGIIFAISGKKVVVIGADMRKPKIYLPVKEKFHVGLSQYLSENATTEEIIHKTDIENLDFIPSGAIPPNPSELLLSHRITELIEALKKLYDIIIFDTPPLGLVSDALLLMPYADANVIVVRHNHTPVRFLKELNEYIQSGKIQHAGFILNDFDIRKNYGYGYRYGVYGVEKQGIYEVNSFKDAYSNDDENKENAFNFWLKLFKRYHQENKQ